MKFFSTSFRKSVSTAVLLSFGVFWTQFTTAQYYYKDILSVQSIHQTQEIYKKNQIKKVTIKSTDADRTPTRDFMCYTLVGQNATTLTTITKTGISGFSKMTSFFNAAGHLIEVKDSTESNTTTTQYRYDPAGRISRIETSIKSLQNDFVQQESHTWQYTKEGFPEQMIRIRNGKDTTLITFITDDKGKVLEEKAILSQRRTQSTYYYYNPAGDLTDIVRYNEKAKRLLPDYLFDYDEAGRLVKSVHIPQNNSQYLTWWYKYDERGLRLNETAVDKQKQVMGRVEYVYE